MRRLAAAFTFALTACAAVAAEPEFRPLTEWRAFKGAGVPPTWTVSENTISHSPGGGDLISVESFRNFELSFEWRIAPGGNSGVMYRVVEGAGAAYEGGPEYQILDNASHPDGQNPLTSAASVYGLYAPAIDVTRPAGDWNDARIRVAGTQVEHWLNGQQVLAYELGSPDWRARVAGSKFAAWPEFGTAAEGHIVLQDHGDPVEYRNIRVRKLPD